MKKLNLREILENANVMEAADIIQYGSEIGDIMASNYLEKFTLDRWRSSYTFPMIFEKVEVVELENMLLPEFLFPKMSTSYIDGIRFYIDDFSNKKRYMVDIKNSDDLVKELNLDNPESITIIVLQIAYYCAIQVLDSKVEELDLSHLYNQRG